MNKKPYIIPSKTNNKNMERYLHKKLSEVGEGGGGGGSDPEAIKYTEQNLTAEQQAQARENIDAYKKPDGGIPASDLADGAHIIKYPQGSWDQIQEWSTSSDGKPIILDVYGQPYLFADADDNDCYTFIGIDVYGQLWKYAIDEQGWLTPTAISTPIESMTAQEVAAAVATAWTNVMGS